MAGLSRTSSAVSQQWCRNTKPGGGALKGLFLNWSVQQRTAKTLPQWGQQTHIYMYIYIYICSEYYIYIYNISRSLVKLTFLAGETTLIRLVLI